MLSEQSESKYNIVMYYVYILRNPQNKLYIGQTKNIQARLFRHNSKQGARFVKDNKNFELVYDENYETQLGAMRREKQLKGWTRAKKETLIASNLVLLKKL